MTEIDPQAVRQIATELILDHARDIEHLTIHENLGDYEDLTEDEQDALADEIHLYIIDAVKQHGDKAAINAAHAALAKASAPNAVDERNELRRQVVDLRDELETMTAERDAKHTEASEMSARLTTAEIRAEDAEAAKERVRRRAHRWASGSLADDGDDDRDTETAIADCGRAILWDLEHPPPTLQPPAKEGHR